MSFKRTPPPTPTSATLDLVKHLNETGAFTGRKRMERDEEQAIIAACKNGDDSQFGRLIEAYNPWLMAKITGMTRNADDAQDVAQEVWTRVWTHIRTFDMKYRFLPWLAKVMHNNTINFCLSRKRKHADSLDTMQEEEFCFVPDTRPTPDMVAHTGELKSQVWKAIESLSQDMRNIIVMRHYHDLSYQDIADVLNIPLGTVMSRLFNARQQIRKHIVKQATIRLQS